MTYFCFNKRLVLNRIFSILAALLLSNSYTNAQGNVAIAPVKMNVFYIGVDNPVSIAASGGHDSKVTVTISGGGGVITKTGNGLYNVRVTEITNECIVTVFINGKMAGSSSFRVRYLPDVFATIGGHISGDSMPADEFKRQAGVGLSIKDFPFDIQYEIISFTFTFDDDQGNIRQFNCQGSTFSNFAKQSINQFIKAGQTVAIDNIRVKGPDGKEWKTPSLVYYIK
ncbi:MAG: hypothetical protein JNK27_13785 [Chitinophagaceae bacterium]|nr:hypothetical protein [Chitinophagaceae bacterium]